MLLWRLGERTAHGVQFVETLPESGSLGAVDLAQQFRLPLCPIVGGVRSIFALRKGSPPGLPNMRPEVLP
jgi:hypothetical protein